jgi:hypothetical protein
MRSAHFVLSLLRAKFSRGTFRSPVGEFIDRLSDMVNDSARLNLKQEQMLAEQIGAIENDGALTPMNMTMLAVWINSCG